MQKFINIFTFIFDTWNNIAVFTMLNSASKFCIVVISIRCTYEFTTSRKMFSKIVNNVPSSSNSAKQYIHNISFLISKKYKHLVNNNPLHSSLKKNHVRILSSVSSITLQAFTSAPECNGKDNILLV